VDKCERLMQEQQVRRITVIDGKGGVIGIVAQADLALKDKPERDAQDCCRDLKTKPASHRGLRRSTAGLLTCRATHYTKAEIQSYTVRQVIVREPACISRRIPVIHRGLNSLPEGKIAFGGLH
jgi:CBS-domain-containing membrane protein